MSKKPDQSNQTLPTDKVLSVKQPYASMIVTEQGNGIGKKWIENRSWCPPEDMRGKILLIHATRNGTLSYRVHGMNIKTTPHGIIGHVRLIGWKRLVLNTDSDKCSDANNEIFERHCKSLRQIVGDHTGVTPRHGKLEIAQERNMVHWVFAEPTLLAEPIPCSGKLRIWTLP